MAQISPIKFRKELNEKLFATTTLRAKGLQDPNDARYEKVQVPESGDIDDFSIGAHASLPLPVKQRTDNVKEYLTQLVKPDSAYLIRGDEDLRLLAESYDKRASVITQSTNKMIKVVNDIAVYSWGASTNVLQTTGTTNRPTTVVGASGHRKRITLADLIEVRQRFNKMEINDDFGSANGNQFALLTPDMITDLLLIDKLTDADKTGLIQLRNGNIMNTMIMGFNIMMRWDGKTGTTGVVYTEASTPVKKAMGAASAATDNAAAIFWDAAYVRSALSPSIVSINDNLSIYAGGTHIYMDCRFGATIKRTDEVGVVTLVEDNA